MSDLLNKLWQFVGFVGAVAIIEIALGSEGRRRLKRGMETLWLRFDDLKIPRVGRAEAVAALTLFDKLFAPRFFSWKRVISCVLVTGALNTIFYIAVEMYRHKQGLYFRPPFIKPHYDNGWPVSILCGAISLSITRFDLVRSLRVNPGIRLESFVMVLIMLFSSAISISVYLFISPVFGAIIHNIITLATSYIRSGISYGNSIFPLVWNDTNVMIIVMKEETIHILRGEPSVLFHMTADLKGLVVSASQRDEALDLNYITWCGLILSEMRFALMFFLLWAIIRPCHRMASHILYRFIESENGDLIILAVILSPIGLLLYSLI